MPNDVPVESPNKYGTFSDDDVSDSDLKDAYENGFRSRLGQRYDNPKELDIHGNWNK